MKILQISKYYNIIGGIEYVIKTVNQGLAEQGHQVTIISSSNSFKKQRIIKNKNLLNVQLACLGTYFSMPIIPALPLTINKLSKYYDIIQLHLPFPLSVLSVLLTNCANKKMVIRYHGDITKQKTILKFYKPFLKKFLSKIGAIIVSNPNMIKYSPILKNFQNKCHVIPIGIEPDNYNCDTAIRKNHLQKISNSKKNPMILFVGRLVYYKGLNILIDAMKDVNANLVVVGDGELKQELKEKCKKFNIENKIDFTGSISYDELIAYYNACDIFVLPSISKAESFGIVLLEAMICGKPVISTDIPSGSPYINKNNETGILVKPNSAEDLKTAIIKLLNNPALRIKMGNAGKTRVEKYFTSQKMIKDTEKLFNELYTKSI